MGETASPDFPVTSGAYDSQNNGNDVFISKMFTISSMELANYLAGNIRQLSGADMNNDGIVNVLDLISLIINQSSD